MIKIFHNPRCSKSRETLSLIRDAGFEPTIVEYLKTPPQAEELAELIAKMNISPRALMRTKEAVYKELKLDDESLTDEALIAAMVENPILIERPIVVTERGARLGRPPVQVREILPEP